MSNRKKRVLIQAAEERARRWKFGLLAGGAVLAAAVLILLPILRRPAIPKDAVKVQIDMAGFQPATINAEAGKPVNIALVNPDNRFHSDGGGKHNFIIEALGVTQLVQPQSTLTFTVTPAQPGQYEFYCDICCGGKENPAMRGVLVVS